MGTMRELSWAERIYQKLEYVCTESDVFQIPLKYVDALGEQLTKMLDEVAGDWADSSGGGVVDPDSILSSEHNVITKDDKDSNDKLSSCGQVDSAVSVGDSNLAPVDVSEGLCPQKRSGTHDEKSNIIEATGSYSSERAGEKYAKNSYLFASPVALTSDLPEPHRSELMNEGSILLGFSSSKDIHGIITVQETVSFSLEKEHEKQNELKKLEAFVRPPEVEVSDSGNKATLNSPFPYLSTEHIELFEDVKHEDCFDNTNNFQLGLLSHHNSKTSYKKKLWRSLVSKVRVRKGHNRVEGFHHVDTGIQNGGRTAASTSASNVDLCCKSTHESDWEIL